MSNSNLDLVEQRAKKRVFGAVQEGRTTKADGAAMPSIEQILEPQADQETDTKRIKIEDDSAYDAALKSIINKDVREVSMKNPVSDFKAMIDNRNEDLVSQGEMTIGSFFFSLVFNNNASSCGADVRSYQATCHRIVWGPALQSGYRMSASAKVDSSERERV